VEEAYTGCAVEEAYTGCTVVVVVGRTGATAAVLVDHAQQKTQATTASRARPMTIGAM